MADRARPGLNGLDPDKVKGFVGRVENLHKDLDKLRSEHMLACKDVRGDIKEVIKEAKGEGINAKALKAAIEQRALERKAKEVAHGLDIDEQSQLEQIRAALGEYADTPLGAAAVSAAGNGARASA